MKRITVKIQIFCYYRVTTALTMMEKKISTRIVGSSNGGKRLRFGFVSCSTHLKYGYFQCLGSLSGSGSIGGRMDDYAKPFM